MDPGGQDDKEEHYFFTFKMLFLNLYYSVNNFQTHAILIQLGATDDT